jgi:hypothetical protein
LKEVYSEKKRSAKTNQQLIKDYRAVMMAFSRFKEGLRKLYNVENEYNEQIKFIDKHLKTGLYFRWNSVKDDIDWDEIRRQYMIFSQ